MLLDIHPLRMCLLDTTGSSSRNLPKFYGMDLTFSMAASTSVENPSQLAFFRLNVFWMSWVVAQ